MYTIPIILLSIYRRFIHSFFSRSLSVALCCHLKQYFLPVRLLVFNRFTNYTCNCFESDPVIYVEKKKQKVNTVKCDIVTEFSSQFEEFYWSKMIAQNDFNKYSSMKRFFLLLSFNIHKCRLSNWNPTSFEFFKIQWKLVDECMVDVSTCRHVVMKWYWSFNQHEHSTSCANARQTVSSKKYMCTFEIVQCEIIPTSTFTFT